MIKFKNPLTEKLIENIIVPIILYIAVIILDDDSILWWIMPYVFAAREVIWSAIRNISHGNFMDEKFLMLVATLGAFYCREYSEAVAVMIFYQIGEFFQNYAVGKSRNAIKELMSIAPDYANREKTDGTIEVIDPDDIWVDDILIIKPGEKIPVDGIVIEGEGFVNAAALTGESIPDSVKIGDNVISGCINGDSLIKIKATKVYEDSTVSKILELVESASTKKSKTEKFITKFARLYTPIVVGSAVLLAVVPSLILGGWNIWILRACTFLVISCPCALVISVPLAFFGGIGAASRIGVLIKGANYLEMINNLDILATDKTGTLTYGEFEISNINVVDEYTEDDIIKYAAAVEKNSTHPIARAIVAASKNPISESMISDVVNVCGKGMTGDVGFSKILAGNASLLIENGIEIPEKYTLNKNTIVYVSKSGKFIGSIEVKDKTKYQARDAIENIKCEGVSRVVMLTGDSEETATVVAGELGISELRARLLPQDKVNAVEELLASLQDSNKYLAYIGDGINDAPVLARADIGIAMGSLGSDAAIEASDIVIMDDNLDKITSLIKISRKTLSISKKNIIFALTVKILCLLLGALGIANMWIAVFADVGVAIICIVNSMRTLIGKEKEYNVES